MCDIIHTKYKRNPTATTCHTWGPWFLLFMRGSELRKSVARGQNFSFLQSVMKGTISRVKKGVDGRRKGNPEEEKGCVCGSRCVTRVLWRLSGRIIVTEFTSRGAQFLKGNLYLGETYPYHVNFRGGGGEGSREIWGKKILLLVDEEIMII